MKGSLRLVQLVQLVASWSLAGAAPGGCASSSRPSDGGGEVGATDSSDPGELPAAEVAPGTADAKAADAKAADANAADAVAGDAGGGNDAALADPRPGRYGMRAPTLEPNSEAAVAALDGKVYMLGGYPEDRRPRRTLQIYDPASNSWKRGEDAPVALHHPMLAGVGGKLYSLGGQPDTDLTLVYDPARDSWRALARMPTARGGGAAAVIDDRIYVVGGRPPGALNAFEVYDVSEDSWTVLPRLPTRFESRNHLAAGAIGGKIYVAGGRYMGGFVESPLTDSLEVYDPLTGSWIARRPLPRPRGGMASVVAGGCLHVYGGEGTNIGEPDGVFPDHDVYDPRTDTWTSLPPLPVPFHGVTGGAHVGGLIYMPGGGIRSGGSAGTTMHQVYRPEQRCE
jgi:N-acetylneuraminic acid mutarotase